jgi:hypothetical protein
MAQPAHHAFNRRSLDRPAVEVQNPCDATHIKLTIEALRSCRSSVCPGVD